MQEFGSAFEFADKKSEKELTKLMLFDMANTGLKFKDVDLSFNNPVDVFGDDGKICRMYRSMWRASI